MRISKEMVNLSQRTVELPSNAIDLFKRIMDLSLEIADFNTQLLRALHLQSQVNQSLVPLQLPVQRVAPVHSPLSKVHASPVPPLSSAPTPFVPPTHPSPVPLPLHTASASLIPRYHDYGDCGETLPLAAMTRVTTREEVRSVAVFITKIRTITSITDVEHIRGSIRLRDPCLNCISLMQRAPENVKVLAGSGWSSNITWTEGSSQTVISEEQSKASDRAPSFQALRFPLSDAYEATHEEIYAILEASTVSNTNPFLTTNQKQTLSILWQEFIIPFRYA